MVNTVVMKFTPPNVDEAPSIKMPEINAVVPGFEPYWAISGPRFDSVNEEYGGYMTHEKAAPSPDRKPM